jgi:DNA-binding transcriptional ArsR family regulator
VEPRRDGNRVFYRIADPYVLRICDAVCDSLAAHARAERKKQAAVVRARKGRAGGER